MIKLIDLAARIAGKHAMSQEDAERFLSQLIGVMNDGLREDKFLKMKGLGTFKIVSVNARESVDVNTGERIKIEEREKVSFVPETSMRDLVNRPFAQFETVVLQDGVDFGEIDSKYAEEESREVQENGKDGSEENLRVSDNNRLTVSDITSDERAEVVSGEREEIVSDKRAEIVSDKKNKKDKMVSDKKSKRRKKNEYDDSHLFDEYGYYIGKEDKEETSWLFHILKNRKSARAVLGIIAFLLISMLIGMCVLYYEIWERDTRLEKFAAEIRDHVTYKTEQEYMDSIRRIGANRFIEYDRMVDSVQKIMMNEDSDYTEAVRAAQIVKDAEIRLKEERLARDEKERKEAEERRLEEERRTDAKRMNEITNKAGVGRELEEYNADPRVRTGAYVITGIERTVTVVQGQTLAGISKAWLGAGMECYVEAVNGGIKSVKPGQEVKIPSLKIKKHRSPKPSWETISSEKED